MLAALLAVVVSQPGGLPLPELPGGPSVKAAPTALETARLYFIAGNLSGAEEWGQRGMKKEAKACRPLLKALAEYAFLMSRVDRLTLDEARQVLELDRAISPKAVGKLTVPIVERFVQGPLARAQLWASQGAAGEAVRFVEDALRVDPKNVEALALRVRLLEVADGGRPWDAGR